ncbi:MAG TPA: response regulator [Clostridia bacterium]|nr:response regulator [Clostridia bacterium]
MPDVPRVRHRLPVLVADDDPNDALLLEIAFMRSGLQLDLHFVRDGREAMDYLEGKGIYRDREAHPLPHLLLLDLRMPRVGGLEVLEWLNHHRSPPNMFVVVMTGSENPGDITLSYAFGADACVPKPCDPARFMSMVSSLARYCLEPAPRRVKRSQSRYKWPDNLFALATRNTPTTSPHRPE